MDAPARGVEFAETPEQGTSRLHVRARVGRDRMGQLGHGIVRIVSPTYEGEQQSDGGARVYSTAKAFSSCLISVSSDGRTLGPNFASTLPSRPIRYF